MTFAKYVLLLTIAFLFLAQASMNQSSAATEPSNEQAVDGMYLTLDDEYLD